MKKLYLSGFLMLLTFQFSHAQCKEKTSRSTKQKIYYQDVLLSGTHEFITLSKTGEEKIFTYNNKLIELIFHVQTFTEIKFTSTKGNFTLFTTASNRNFWNSSFTLSSPVTPDEIEKMKGAVKIEIMLPEETKIYSIGSQKNNLLNKALQCII
ncbi:hypothetical protein [Dyadobacter sediminis]|uniref:Uncharacterized protein n=1 Tax=Dyadobacter sediminis TaxID=1493691 RepID=A0A5R9KKC4_9BACT|nr:hypothetical protein [Dyadobacter sediminis]TLU96671.1 hypothetical protein FEM55_05985 [Dyadobacter sediminis]GGB84202.1 hypothetical protein GCM10011325_09740 [Dyadobacter sediminis]